MRNLVFLILMILIGRQPVVGQPANFVWDSQSLDSSGSMPCGGGDIGMNVWVEEGDIFFYLSRSGSFDENNTLLKQGRFRVRLTPNPFEKKGSFKQTLCLKDGYVSVSTDEAKVNIWADVFHPVVHVEVETHQLTSVRTSYESWRTEDGRKQPVIRRDSILVDDEALTFFHRNPERTLFDVTVEQQGLEDEKEHLYNPLQNLVFGGRLSGDNLVFTGTRRGHYAETDYESWMYKSKRPVYKQSVRIVLHAAQGSVTAWNEGLKNVEKQVNVEKDRLASRRWWNEFWERSFIESEGEAADAARNYTLVRYMLGCNAYGVWPTKFNGGLFTFDPAFLDRTLEQTPDYRPGRGGTMPAHNQALIYWPMLKSGDYDLMKSQFDVYARLLATAETRTRVYWGHAGACFSEELENFGLPAADGYGWKRPEGYDKGLEYNESLEYEWTSVLEFCRMILETNRYGGVNITPYVPLIESTLNFFDTHYRSLAAKRGMKELDGNGKLVLYPASAGGTYQMAYNPSSLIAALRTVLETYGRKPDMLARIPEIPVQVVDGKEMILPAKVWERISGEEAAQLYTVFPWRTYGMGKKNLETARNTYLYDKDALRFRSHEGWKLDNVWAACLGLTEEASESTLRKLANGPYRFPAFWKDGSNCVPDLNRATTGMLGMQEMLLQETDGKLLLFPAWPREWNVHFKLHATGKTTVEVTLKDGKVVNLIVSPKEREKDIVNCLENR